MWRSTMATSHHVDGMNTLGLPPRRAALRISDAAFCAEITIGFCSRLAVMGVSTNPGFTVTTFTPWRATRLRSASSHVVSPALLVEYAGNRSEEDTSPPQSLA